MKRLFAVIAMLGLCGVGCGKDAKPLVDAAEKYQKDSCACKDAECLKKAADDYQAATNKLKDQKLAPSEEQAKKISAATTKAVECNTKLSTELATKAAGQAMPSGMPKVPGN